MRVAVIELGSRTFRLVVARVAPGAPPALVAQEQHEVRLDAVAARRGFLPDPARQRAAGVVAELMATAGRCEADVVEVLRTGWVWSADPEAAAMVTAAAEGADVVDLSARQATELHSFGALTALGEHLGEKVGPATVLHIAPTRVHVAIPPTPQRPGWAATLPLGPSRLIEGFDAPLRLGQQQQVSQRALRALDRVSGQLVASRDTTLVVTGLPRQLAQVVRAHVRPWPPKPPLPRRVPVEDLRAVHRLLVTAPSAVRSEVSDPTLLHPMILLLDAFLRVLPPTHQQMWVVGQGIAEGRLALREHAAE